MEFFRKVKSVKLISYKDKYLAAEDDLVTISQDNKESITTSKGKLSAKNAIWTVEFIEENDLVIRLKSCFGTYLTASSHPFIPRVTGKRVIQTVPYYGDIATEWEPMRDGMQVRLRSFCGNFLRPHGGIPPLRNSVTHDFPHLPKTWNKILWDVEPVEKLDKMAPPSKNYFSRSRSRSLSGSMTSKVHNVVISQERS